MVDMPDKKLKIAIDGPAGAGKSTVARLTAEKLGYTYIDTGAMYRALAVTAVSLGIDLTDENALGEMARSVRLEAWEDKGVFRVFVDGKELTSKLRGSQTDRAVKILAMATPVREVLVKIQRRLAKPGGVVMEGRDITSVVLKDAEIKVFLTADPEVRAKRRFQELRDKGIQVSFQEVMEDMVERDRKDLERDWGKLVKVPDAVLIDSTHMTIEEVSNEIVKLCEAKARCSTG
jgi:cytidylate kinase